MRKAELTGEQLKTVERVTRKLSASGWDFDEWLPQFEAGGRVWPEVPAGYEGSPAASLFFTYSLDSEYVNVLISSKDHSHFVTFRFYTGSKLDELLDLLIQNQDAVTISNYRGLVRKMRDLCGGAFWEEQGLEGPPVTDEDLEEPAPKI